MINLTRYKDIINETKTLQEVGKVIQIIGLIIEADGPKASIGDLCYIYNKLDAEPIWAEVVGFKTQKILLMPLGSMEGLMPGAMVKNTGAPMKIKVGDQLLGRVLNGLGEPIDNLGAVNSQSLYSTHADAINPLNRQLIREPLSLGIRSIDGFITQLSVITGIISFTPSSVAFCTTRFWASVFSTLWTRTSCKFR